MIVELEIKDITIPQGLLPRVITGTVAEKVEEYAEMIEQGIEFDPISVWRKGNEYWVIDGVHRLSAHKKAGKTTIKAKLVECKDELDYRIKAIQANLKHGLALAKEERPLLAQILYKEGVSEEEIRKVFGISERTLYRWLEQIKEQERQEKVKKVLELKEKGYTQEQIAKELGVDKSTVSRWLGSVAKMTTWQKCNILDKEVGNNQKEDNDDDWIRGWEEAVREEEEREKQKQQKKIKDEEEEIKNPILRDYEKYRDEFTALAYECAKKHGVYRTVILLKELIEELEEEGRDGILEDYYKVW